MAVFLSTRIRVNRHLGIDDRRSYHGIRMRHGLWFFDDTGITRTGFDFRWRNIGRRGRRRWWHRKDIRRADRINGQQSQYDSSQENTKHSGTLSRVRPAALLGFPLARFRAWNHFPTS